MVVGPANEFVREGEKRKFLNCTHLESTSRKTNEKRKAGREGETSSRLKRRLHGIQSRSKTPPVREIIVGLMSASSSYISQEGGMGLSCVTLHRYCDLILILLLTYQISVAHTFLRNEGCGHGV